VVEDDLDLISELKYMFISMFSSRRIKRLILILSGVFSLALFLNCSRAPAIQDVEKTPSGSFEQQTTTPSIEFFNANEQSIYKNLEPATPIELGRRLRLFDKVHQERSDHAKVYKKIYRALFPWLKIKPAHFEEFHGQGIVMCLGDKTKSMFIQSFSLIHITVPR
jgi:hypothetical protein